RRPVAAAARPRLAARDPRRVRLGCGKRADRRRRHRDLRRVPRDDRPRAPSGGASMVAMNAVGALAVVLGAVLGLGLWLVTSAVPRLGRPRLVERVAPYVADLSPAARALLDRRPADPSPVLGVLVSPVARR